MMRPAQPGGARYRGCRTANIRHLDFDASFWFWTPKMMHHFDFGQRSNDAPCRLVWTYGGLVTKIGSGDACDACVNRCERKKQMLLVNEKKPIDGKKSHKSGHKVATFADSAFCCFVFYIRSLHGIVIHIWTRHCPVDNSKLGSSQQ